LAEEGEEYGGPAAGVWDPHETYKYIYIILTNHRY
jgi:hypothetical protein